jgi:mannose-6-phosphate isomerase-like protein (cupin superfamily)
MGVIEKSSAEHYRWGGICDGWRLVETGTHSIIEERVPPGGSESRHFHKGVTQFFYVLKGVLSFEINGNEHDVSPRQGIEIGPLIPHRVFNRSASDAEFLVFSTPPSHGDREPA